MVQSASLFSQALSLIDRRKFNNAVIETASEHAAKGFGSWDHLVSMLFCQMASADSLREICGGLATAAGKLVHLGMSGMPCRSTLAYANGHRPSKLFEQIFYDLLGQASALAGLQKRRFRFKNPLRSIDSTTIELCLTLYDWAKFRRTKGAVKLHLMLDHQGCLPKWVLITDGKTHDVRAAWLLSLDPGTIVAMDRGYVDYALFARWTKQEVWFVTRAKDNMAYRVVADRPLAERAGTIVHDQEIELTGYQARQDCPHRLRRVVVWDEEKQREIVLLTNNMKFSARTIAAIYKDRWQIELFFKAIKQNLKIKTFVGTSRNAVEIQIWTALIGVLLLRILQLRSSFGWSLSNLAAMLRFNLLTYRDLWRWLDDPYPAEPQIPPGSQMFLFS
jgi:hypothetical protein